MFKKFLPNPEYELDLNSNVRHKGILLDRALKMYVETSNHVCDLWVDWMSLIAHYEIDLPIERCLNIHFVKSESKVIGLRCKKLMVVNDPIEMKSGFFMIPGFPRFVISKQGVVMSNRGKVLKPSIGPYGYPYVNLYDPDKLSWRSVCLHILIARTFIVNRDPTKKIYVNHVDGNKLNYAISNLEWVTSSENCTHAIENGLRNDNVKCRVKDYQDGQIHLFDSLSQAYAFMGFSNIRPMLSIKQANGIVPILFKHRFEIHTGQNSDEWFYDTHPRDKNKITGPFQAFDLSTGKIHEASTFVDLAKITNVNADRISTAVRRTSAKIVEGYIFRQKSEEAWPDNVVPIKWLPPVRIELRNIETNETIAMKSKRQAKSFLGCDKATLASRLASGKPYGIWEVRKVQ